MKTSLSLFAVALWKAVAFQPLAPTTATRQIIAEKHQVGRRLMAVTEDENVSHDSFYDAASSRRMFVQHLLTLPAYFAMLSAPSLAVVEEQSSSPKILVLGGTGFVGHQVVQLLQQRGLTVVATSRNGRDGTVALSFGQDDNMPTDAQLSELISGCTAVISCVGAIGTPNDLAVNAGTGRVAQVAAQNGVPRFVYITVAPEVKEFAKDIDFLKNYMRGKTISRDAVLSAFTEKAVLIEPTFIYGGGSFELNPPRVAAFYGQFIEGLLSSSPIRTVERVLSPGIVKIALEPPVPVEDVARAAVAGALGKTDSILDTYDKIKKASQALDG